MAEPDTEILVVDDEAHVTDLLKSWLEPDYSVETANSGLKAIEVINDDIDVVLLDRNMPDLSGDETLKEMIEQGYDARYIMVTSVDPDFNIVELGFDEYVTKPTVRDQIVDVIERVLERTEDENVREYKSLETKRELLETEKDEQTLEDSPEYQELVYQELVRKYIEKAFNANDQDAIDDICHPDVTTHGPSGNAMNNIDALKTYQRQLHDRFDDIDFETELLFAEDGVDMVAIRGSFRGTHVGEFKGIEPTGQSIEWYSHYFFRIDDGKIAEIWALPDTYGIVEQLTGEDVD